MGSLEDCKRLKYDNYLYLRLKNNLNIPVIVDRMAFLQGKSIFCLAYSKYQSQYIEFKDNKYYLKVNDKENLFINISNIKSLAMAMKKVKHENYDCSDQYILFPKTIYDKIIDILKDDKDDISKENNNDSKHDILKLNILNSLNNNFAPNKRSNARRIAEELLCNPKIVFENESGRTFQIDRDPDQRTINTYDFIKCVSYPDFGGILKSKKKKKNQLFATVVQILFENNCPQFYILNKNYK